MRGLSDFFQQSSEVWVNMMGRSISLCAVFLFVGILPSFISNFITLGLECIVSLEFIEVSLGLRYGLYLKLCYMFLNTFLICLV